jgi:hydrogenase maturation factor
MSLPAGKLPAEMLAAFLAGLPPPGPDVVVGAALGEDAAVLDVGGRYLVLAADPVTLSAQPGRFAVQINANDVVVMGAEPRWLLATVLLPAGTDDVLAGQVLRDLADSCASIRVSLIGGHTEITPTVSRPVIAATMVGEVWPDRLVRSSGARVGDALLLARPIAIEGTAILAGEFADELRDRGVTEEAIDAGKQLARRLDISVLPAARALLGAVLPHAMHDPTEGGVLGAAWELAAAARTGLRVYGERVPVLPACRAICEVLALDPLFLLASGSLLAAVAREDVPAAHAALREAGIESAIIGEFLQPESGVILESDGRERVVSSVPRDELARWIEERG